MRPRNNYHTTHCDEFYDEPIEYRDTEEELEGLFDINAEICQVGISGHDIFEVTNAETGHKFIVWKKED